MLRRLRHRLEYAVLVLVGLLIPRLPLSWVRALGRALGRAAFELGVARRTARENVEVRLGLREPAQRDHLLRQAYAHFGQTLAEIAYTPALSRAQIREFFDFEGLEPIRARCAAGQGVVCLSAHFGNWEWMGAALVEAGIPVTFLVGTQSNPWADRAFLDIRRGKGIEMVRIHHVREAMRTLKAGKLLALLGDQDGDKWGVFAPFFGVPASTHVIGEMLARRTGSPIAFGVPVRGADGRSRVQACLLPEAPAGLDERRATAWVLAEYNRRLEAAIREHPEQWLWMHQRWRSVPLHRLEGEERARAERGEIEFDCAEQVWRDVRSGERVDLASWK
jgi:KDO2-lipid IV(A) lauroyltransferase